MNCRRDVIVIGGGQAGLAARYELAQRGIDHVVLERDSVAAKWRERWDSFTLVTPNWTRQAARRRVHGRRTGRLPAARRDRPATSSATPACRAARSSPASRRRRSRRRPAATASKPDQGPFEARAVIVATGTFQKPKRPPDIGTVAPAILELHSSAYRNPDQLPPGGVLIIGSAQTGMQLADELLEAGRRVFISTGKAGRLPRRYRGRDGFRWWEDWACSSCPSRPCPRSPLAARATHTTRARAAAGHSICTRWRVTARSSWAG